MSVITASSKLSLIPISYLLRNRFIRTDDSARVKAAVKESGGQVAALIHPWFSQMHVYDKAPPPARDLTGEFDVFSGCNGIHALIRQDIPQAAYRDYCEKIWQRLSELEWPLFIFISTADREATSRMLESTTIKSPIVIEVPTLNNDPEPDWQGLLHQKHAWAGLKNVLYDLGVFKMTIMGELGYINKKGMMVGCVYKAMDFLLDCNGITIKPDDEHIFPNIRAW